MGKFGMSLVAAITLLAGLSTPTEASFVLSTGYNDHSSWGSVVALQPYFQTEGYLSGPQNSQAAINPIIAAAMGVSDAEGFLIYKDDRGGSESGSADVKASYDTTYSNSNRNATISYSANPSARIYTHVPTYLYLKDGNADPNWYLFDITDLWDGVEDLVMEDFFPTHSISHVTIYGGSLDAPSDSLTAVPEPASMAVWGSVLAVGAFARRRRRSIAA